MALLQIAEPGRAAAPHQQRWVVGIDLGTTHSLVATVRSGLPTVLVDEEAVRCCRRWCTTRMPPQPMPNSTANWQVRG